MNNMRSFPIWRGHGIAIKFGEHRYSWCENTDANRKYLIESNYCNNAIEIYVFENDITYYNVNEFKEYLKSFTGYGACPLCGSKLVVRINRKVYDGKFVGCSAYPECRFTKKE